MVKIDFNSKRIVKFFVLPILLQLIIEITHIITSLVFDIYVMEQNLVVVLRNFLCQIQFFVYFI